MVRSSEVLHRQGGARAYEVGSRAYDQVLSTWVHDFDDQTLDAYSGDKGSYGFETSDPIQGVASLLRTDSTSGYEIVTSTSGLYNYPAKGNTFQWKIRAAVDSADTGAAQVGGMFGVTDASNYYSARYEFIDDDFILFKETGGTTSILASDVTATDGGYTDGTVLTVEVTWDDGTLGGNDNDITAKLMSDDKQTTHATVSASDSDHATKTGVGVRTFSDAAAQEPTADAYRILS